MHQINQLIFSINLIKILLHFNHYTLINNYLFIKLYNLKIYHYFLFIIFIIYLIQLIDIHLN